MATFSELPGWPGWRLVMGACVRDGVGDRVVAGTDVSFDVGRHDSRVRSDNVLDAAENRWRKTTTKYKLDIIYTACPWNKGM
jgi:hypothetical protein